MPSSSLIRANALFKYLRLKFRRVIHSQRIRRTRSRSSLRTKRSSASLNSSNSVAGGVWGSAHMFSALSNLHYPRRQRRRQSTASVEYEDDDNKSLVVPASNARGDSEWETDQDNAVNYTGIGSGAMMQVGSAQPVSLNGSTSGRAFSSSPIHNPASHTSPPLGNNNNTRSGGGQGVGPPIYNNRPSSASPRGTGQQSAIKPAASPPSARRKPPPPPPSPANGSSPSTSPRQPSSTLVAVPSSSITTRTTKPSPSSPPAVAAIQPPRVSLSPKDRHQTQPPSLNPPSSASTTQQGQLLRPHGQGQGQQQQHVPASLSTTPKSPLTVARLATLPLSTTDRDRRQQRRVSIASSNSATGSESDQPPTGAATRFAVAVLDPNLAQQSSSDSAPGEMYTSSRSSRNRGRYVSTSSDAATYGSSDKRRESSGYYKSTSTSERDRKHASYPRDSDRSDRERSDRERSRYAEKEKERDRDREREREKRQPLLPLVNSYAPPREKARVPPPSSYVRTMRAQPPQSASSRNVRFRDTLLFSPTPPSSIPPSPVNGHHSYSRSALPQSTPAMMQPYFMPTSAPSTPHSSPSTPLHPLTSMSSHRSPPNSKSKSLHPLTPSHPHTSLPPPTNPKPRRAGWFNASGDQLWTNEGGYVAAPPGIDFPEYAGYPKRGDGWMNENGKIIDMQHRLVRESFGGAYVAPQKKESGYLSSGASSTKKSSKGLFPLKSALKKRS